MSDDNYTELGPADELKQHPVVPYYVEEYKRRISVTKIDGELYAFDDLCTHEACPLSAGLLIDKGEHAKCQCHGSQFNLKTGEVLKGPATKPLGSYKVRETDGTIEADLSGLEKPK